MLPGTQAAHSYTDFAALAELRTSARRDAGGTLEEVARQFESLFMQMMMKSMRDAGFGDALLGSRTVEFYQGMLDDQLSLELSRSGGLGIADMLTRQLRPGVAANAPPAPPVVHPAPAGGTPPPAAAVPATPAHATVPPAGEGFTDRQAFVDRLRPAATRAARALGVPPGLLLAQAALETGWGQAVPRHADGTSSHNLFGIKADARWAGPRVTVSTLEFRDGVAARERASFRAYDSYGAAFEDYVEFLRSGIRYHPALERAGDPEGFMRGLHEAGYATDPHYADKVLRIWREDLMRSA